MEWYIIRVAREEEEDGAAMDGGGKGERTLKR